MKTLYCGKINSSHIGKKVTLYGWISKFKNLGNIIFINIRDREGIIQVFFDSAQKDIFNIAKKLRNEFCVKISGIIKKRLPHQINETIPTGQLEIECSNITILNFSEPLPIDYNKKNNDTIRLKYRYLDLRQSTMIDKLIKRSNIISSIRLFMEKKNFINIETPILAKSSSEGARDYLVPSRIHKNKFYALPQSPQIFKQLLMISGFDRYYQIAKCFRDEDIRSDRQPEFTQLDLEASFVNEKKIRSITEQLIRYLWKKFLNINLEKFPILTYNDSINKFGTDKPDLRNPIELINIDHLIHDNNIEFFKLFTSYKRNFGKITALCIPTGSQIKYSEILQYHQYIIKHFGANNIIWIKITTNTFLHNTTLNMQEYPLKKYLSIDIIKNIISYLNAEIGDIVFIKAGTKNIVSNVFNFLRIKIGTDLQLYSLKQWKPLWIIDFPLFKTDKYNKIQSMRHPFTSPKHKIIFPISDNTLKNSLSNSYDMIINGYEIGGGSVRIHSYEIQKNIFNILGINTTIQQKQFGYLLNALKYGTPPHAGFAFGLDRVIMLLTNSDNLRDVIAFPKTHKAIDLLTNTPCDITY